VKIKVLLRKNRGYSPDFQKRGPVNITRSFLAEGAEPRKQVHGTLILMVQMGTRTSRYLIPP